MPSMVGVRFQQAGKLYWFDPIGLPITERLTLVVPSPQGPEMARAVTGVKEVLDNGRPLEAVLRIATAADLALAERWQRTVPDVLEQARRLDDEFRVGVKWTAAEFSFDGRRLALSYNAPERAEVGAVAQRIADLYDCRVDARHTADRDMAKQTGDLGLCGYTLCCRSWLTEFPPVSIKMAKNQDLPLNPQKISGACGRLLCCLAYENDQYSQLRARMPRYGASVMTPLGAASVRDAHVLRETVSVWLEDQFQLAEVKVADITRPDTGPPPAVLEAAAADGEDE